MAALSDAKYQERTPYLAKTFLEAFRKYCIFVFLKSFYQIPWRSDFTGLPSFLHVKRLQGTTDTPGYDKKISDRTERKAVKARGFQKSEV